MHASHAGGFGNRTYLERDACYGERDACVRDGDSEIELISNVTRAMANVMRASVTGIRKSAFLNQSLHNIHYRTFLAVINRGKPRSDNNKIPHANAVRKHSPPPEHALKTKPSHPSCQRGSKTEPIPIDPTPLPMHPCPNPLVVTSFLGRYQDKSFQNSMC